MKSPTAILGSAGAIVLLAGLAVGAAGQDASPEPSPAGSPAALEVETAFEPLPVADYWVEWIDHKLASHERMSRAIQSAKRSRSKTARWYRDLVGVHEDELRWLANHQPLACYQDEFGQWRRAVEDLHAIHQKALRFVRAEDAQGVRRTAKQRQEAVKRLNGALANVASCGPSEPDTAEATVSGDPFVGTWKTVRRFVNEDGANFTMQTRLKFTRDGRFLYRVKRGDFCRQSGFGFVPLTLQGRGEFVMDGTLQFVFDEGKLHCYPRGGGRVLMDPDVSNPPPNRWHYDEAYDVLFGIAGAGSCAWRAKGGSPKDCEAFWRGTPPKSEGVEAPVDDAAGPGEEATASPDVDEG